MDGKVDLTPPMQLSITATLLRVAEYEIEGKKGFSGAVGWVGGLLKFGCDHDCCRALELAVGRTVSLVGLAKIAGEKGAKPELKIAQVSVAAVEGQRVYSRSAVNDPAAAVELPGRDAASSAAGAASAPKPRAGIFSGQRAAA